MVWERKKEKKKLCRCVVDACSVGNGNRSVAGKFVCVLELTTYLLTTHLLTMIPLYSLPLSFITDSLAAPSVL